MGDRCGLQVRVFTYVSLSYMPETQVSRRLSHCLFLLH